ncbi:unnamed protein product [Boreogadus saida]
MSFVGDLGSRSVRIELETWDHFDMKESLKDIHSDRFQGSIPTGSDSQSISYCSKVVKSQGRHKLSNTAVISLRGKSDTGTD